MKAEGKFTGILGSKVLSLPYVSVDHLQPRHLMTIALYHEQYKERDRLIVPRKGPSYWAVTNAARNRAGGGGVEKPVPRTIFLTEFLL